MHNGSLKTKVQIMDEKTLKRTMMRLSYEIVEKNEDLSDIVLVGIKTRGIPLARMLQDNIYKNTQILLPLGSLDISFYRDDLEKVNPNPKVSKSDLPFDINEKKVILVDDVLFTGRTVRAAIDALFDLGRPSKVSLAILIDRGHRELPIRPDYIGKNIPTSLNEVVAVNLEETDGYYNVEIMEKI